MKTKLLKKIRKRFSIVHYPNGYQIYWLGTKHTVNGVKGCVRLEDNKDKHNKTFEFKDHGENPENAKNKALERILEITRCEYPKLGKLTLRNKTQGIKLWHNAV